MEIVENILLTIGWFLTFIGIINYIDDVVHIIVSRSPTTSDRGFLFVGVIILILTYIWR